MVCAARTSNKVSSLRTGDKLEGCVQILRTFNRDIEREKKLMTRTCEFWEIAGHKLTGLKTPSRRIVLDSRVVPIGVSNAASFSKNWIILVC